MLFVCRLFAKWRTKRATPVFRLLDISQDISNQQRKVAYENSSLDHRLPIY